MKFCITITNLLIKKSTKEINDEVDIIFLIHGDLLNKDFMEFLKKKYNKSIFVMYQWDSVKNNKNIPFLAKYFHKVFSFDREDCKNFGYYYLPNFYISSIKNNSSNENNYDLLFVGKGHTDRIYFLNKIKESLPKKLKQNS